MKTYEIEVQELVSQLVKIKADSIDEAIDIVKTMYENKQIVLSPQ